MTRFTLKREPTVPLEVEVLSPDVISGKSHSEVCGLPIYHGKRRLRVDDFFEVEGDGTEDMEIIGDLRRARWIGRAMSSGSITVQGSVGMHLGAYMSGGAISVSGDAGDWVGAEMRKGTIKVSGNAGGQVGAGYRGSMKGMRNGLIHIGGDVGLEVGLRMRRGTIVVGGTARDFTGLQMIGGTIVLLNGAEIRTGAWMNRGTIISMKPLQIMPTFQPSGTYVPSFLSIYAKYLQEQLGVTLPSGSEAGVYQRYVGDAAVPGKGEILVWTPQESVN